MQRLKSLWPTDLALIIRARYSLIYIPTIEEERVEKSIRISSQPQDQPPRQILIVR